MPLAVIACVVLGVAIVVITYRPPPTLSAEELHDYFANQWLEFWHFERNWSARSDEKLDGDSEDWWMGKRSVERWWIENDSLCFEWPDGSGCWRVAVGPGDRIYWYTLEGDYDGTVTMRRVGGGDG